MIDKKQGRTRSLALLATAAMAWGMRPIAVQAAAADQPANVIYIISDDQAFGDYGFMGNSLVQTPNIDRLASLSARYVNGYVPSSVCRPSLATLLTGRYPHQHGICFNHPPPGFQALGQLPSVEAYDHARAAAVDLFMQSPTLPRMLAKAGYVSFQAGKHWEGAYQDGGFTEGMTINRPCFDQPWNRRLPNGQWVAHGNGDFGLLIGRKTMQPVYEFIDRHVDRPFLLWYAPVLPHEPHNAPDRYRNLFTDTNLPEHLIGYYANIAWFDDTIGQLLDYLDGKGLSRNTLFVYVCDNGWANASGSAKQDKRSKRSPFENGIRTPILLRWDDVIKPATHQGLVSSVDLATTVLAALGVDAAAYDLPGVDLLPSATGQQSLDPDRAVFGEIYPGDARSLGNPRRDVAYRWIRQRNLKLIVPYANANGEPWNSYVRELTLYDLAIDPEETRNLATNPEYASDVERLRKRLKAWP